MTSLTEDQYKTLAEYPFHVTARAAVASGSAGDAGEVWSQVENQGY